MRHNPMKYRLSTRSRLVLAGAGLTAVALVATPMMASASGSGPATAKIPAKIPASFGLPTIPSVAGTALPFVAGGAGAKVPFTEYEAENARTNGSIVGPSRAFTQLAAEASGRKAVQLASGQYVAFVLAKPANAVDIRYAIPDGPDSTLQLSAGGQSLPAVTLTSAYSHIYGNYPFTKNVSEGGEHHYFDDVRTMFGRTLPAGTAVVLQASASTVIDLADFENVAAAGTAPAGYLNVNDFGADPTGATDSGAAIQTAINAASTAGQGLWIPVGTYKVTQQLVVDNVTIKGAGPWYSVLAGAGVGIFGKPAPTPSSAVHLSDFAIFGATTIRDDQSSDSGLGGSMGGGSTVENLWIQHTKVGAWFDGPVDGLTISDTRIQDTMADGINLHDGVSDVTVQNTFVRNTGDDGMAMWSDQNADHDNVFTHDTVSEPQLANGFAIYGGHDNTISDDIASDTVTQGGGVHVGNRFGSVPLAGTTTIEGNVLIRTGDLVPNDPTEIGAIWFDAVDEAMTGTINVSAETLVDSSFSGIQFVGKSITNVHVNGVAILGAGTSAVDLDSPGAATFAGVTAFGLGGAGVNNCASGFEVTKGKGNLGWSTTACGYKPAGQLEIAQATGIDFGFQSLGSTTAKALTITNPGPKPITITSVTPPAGFTVDNTCGTIAAGATCTLQAVFTPTASANYTGLVTIDSTSPAGPYVVSLTGVGFDPNGDLALGRTVTSSSETSDYYGPQRLVDGDQSTYFESLDGTFPQTVTLDLGQVSTVDRIVLTLPPGWGTRVETIAISADGSPLVASADYTLDPSIDNNAVTITFPATSLQKITLTCTNNTGWDAFQLSEVSVYAH
jgi:Pectate lyase superfamily protein/Abnormal spindle-like microcephaly-assoc'd, ASPM-SPD-2-Hydin/F5/8 type C domain